MKEFVKSVELVVELNEQYTKELLSLQSKLHRNDDLTIGEETLTKGDILKCEGKLLALQDMLELIKEKTGQK